MYELRYAAVERVELFGVQHGSAVLIGPRAADARRQPLGPRKILVGEGDDPGVGQARQRADVPAGDAARPDEADANLFHSFLPSFFLFSTSDAKSVCCRASSSASGWQQGRS